MIHKHIQNTYNPLWLHGQDNEKCSLSLSKKYKLFEKKNPR